MLEVVLAVTILAAMSGLIATLWGQASRMAGDGGSQQRAMRLARVVEMMRSQWADRRTSVSLDRSGASVAIEPEGVSFITATAVLEPGWPIVRARYLVERDYETGIGREAGWRLVYEELPVVAVAEEQGVPGLKGEEIRDVPERRPESPREKRMVLLNGCAELRWERFGRAARVEAAEADRLKSGDEGTNGTDSSKEPAARSEAERTEMWREFEEEWRGKSPAVRLAGQFEGKEFACVFVIGDSR